MLGDQSLVILIYQVKRSGSSILLKTLTWMKSLVVALISGPGNIPLMVITCSKTNANFTRYKTVYGYLLCKFKRKPSISNQRSKSISPPFSHTELRIFCYNIENQKQNKKTRCEWIGSYRLIYRDRLDCVVKGDIPL